MFKHFSLSILAGLLLFVSWPPITSFTFLIFFALVPLFLIEQAVFENQIRHRIYFFYTYLTFFIFNLLTTFWINYAHFGGAVFAILCNSFFMALVFYLSLKIKSVFNKQKSILILPILWIGFEYLHLNWDLSWPWLTLGNVFASHPDWVQWYSYTGVLGGTLWILLSNLIVVRLDVFKTISKISRKDKFRLRGRLMCFILLICLWFIPFGISKNLYTNYLVYFNNTQKQKINILIAQPNIDPYSEKFSISQMSQTDELLDLVTPYLNDSINFLILPETFLYTPIWMEKIFNNLSVKQLYEVVSQYPRDIQFDKKHYYPLNILVGATTLSLSNKSPSSKPLHNHKNNFYKVFNTTLHLKNHLLFEDSVTPFSDGTALDKYHKSKLVPGAEQMPFQDILYPFLGDKILQIGASTSLGNFSRQDTITIFHSFKFEEKIGRCDFSVAPIICYESIYGDYVRRFVHKGAEVIFIITNDGWWKDTSGYKQHNMYAKLRAIETRRYIARSANTGISCVINPFGKIEKKIDWDVRDVIKTEITLNNDRTFYTQYGDVIGRIASFLSVLLLLYTVIYNKLHFSS